MSLFILLTLLLPAFHSHGLSQQTSPDSGVHLAGHLQPLGSHRAPEGFIDVVEGFIHPKTFYSDYVRASKPLLFRGAAKSLPAYQHWNDAYLQQKYGEVPVQIETTKKEDRDVEAHEISMNEFLDAYQNKEIYMVQEVPADMDDDLGVPKPLLCGGFQDLLYKALMWFSSGGTRSVLHLDELDNINCLMDGEKDLIMIDRAHKEDVEAYGFIKQGGYSKVDVDAVDFEKFPRLQLPWWKAQMQKGDCLYIPLGWYHQVNSRGRNLAVNLWFQHLMWFNQSDCDAYAADVENDFMALAKFDLTGTGSIEIIRDKLFSPFEKREHIKVEDVEEELGHILSNLQVHEFFQLADSNKDFVISWDEVYSADAEKILSKFPHLFPDYFEDEESKESGQETDENMSRDEL